MTQHARKQDANAQNKLIENIISNKELGILLFKTSIRLDRPVLFHQIKQSVSLLIVVKDEKLSSEERPRNPEHSLKMTGILNSGLINMLSVLHKMGIVSHRRDETWQLSPAFIEMLMQDLAPHKFINTDILSLEDLLKSME